jgi:signal transduction histidine kinase
VRDHAIKRRKGQAPPRYEARLLRKDGTVRHGEFSVQAITYQGEYAAIGSIRDVTERKEAEDALRVAKEEAEEMNRLKSAFLANMSHEIRTPLTSIIGFTEVLSEEDLGEGNRFIELIRRGGERLLDTLNSVLDLSQLEAGSMRLTPAPLDVAEEVRETVDLFKPRAAKHDVDLAVDVPDRPLPAELDGAGLRRILSNLLSNATKFTEPGDQITVRITPKDDAFTLEVEDTGVGIDTEFLPHLFDAFQQESTGAARAYEGSGLGLAITHQLTELMGGSIDVESTKGEGTCFTVRLPRQMESVGAASGRTLGSSGA